LYSTANAVWCADRLLLTQDLDRGSQFPYIKRAMEEGFEVVVLNTNLNKFPDNSRGSDVKVEDVPVTTHFFLTMA